MLRDLRGGTFLQDGGRGRRAVRAARRRADRDRAAWRVRAARRPGRARASGPVDRGPRRSRPARGRGRTDGATDAPESKLQKLFKPREKTYTWVEDYFPRAYHHWGRIFFSPLTVTFLILLALAGFGAFAYIVGARYGTPFVVAQPARDRRRGVRRRPVCDRRVPRAGARSGARSLRSTRSARRAAAHPHIPVRVRRHERGVLRVTLAPDRDQRRRARVRSDARARCSRSPARWRAEGDDRRGVLSAGVRRLHRCVLQPEPVPRPRRLQHPRRLSCASRACGSARERSCRSGCPGTSAASGPHRCCCGTRSPA